MEMSSEYDGDCEFESVPLSPVDKSSKSYEIHSSHKRSHSSDRERHEEYEDEGDDDDDEVSEADEEATKVSEPSDAISESESDEFMEQSSRVLPLIQHTFAHCLP